MLRYERTSLKSHVCSFPRQVFVVDLTVIIKQMKVFLCTVNCIFDEERVNCIARDPSYTAYPTNSM